MAGITALPEAGLVTALFTDIVQTPTFVVMLITPTTEEPSPGPLSTIVIEGSVPSEMVRVAAPLAVQARKASATAALRILIGVFMLLRRFRN
jgi:hypothetical protein